MKKIMNFKRVMSLIAVIAVLFSMFSVAVYAGTASDAKNSVVAVISQDGKKLGSGFAIGEVGKPVEFIVTNNHVVQGIGFTTADVGFDLASNERVTANVYFSDAEKDIAILKLPQPTIEREAMVLRPVKYVDLDDAFAALGYPAGGASDWEKYNKDDITITKGGIKKIDRVNGLDVYDLDLDITYGSSGGPLVNSLGDVVGINTFGKAGNNYAIAIDELISVVDMNRIPLTIYSGYNWFLIIAIAAALIILILIIVLIAGRKKSEPEFQPVPNGMGGAGVTAEMTRPTPAPNPQQGARVVAVGGTLNGRRYTVNGTAKMGRDAAQFSIAFPVNTQGVSGVHCEVAFDGAVCYVKDLNSRYGTFTADGRKLAPNVPQILKHGDKFYLASPENTFEIRF